MERAPQPASQESESSLEEQVEIEIAKLARLSAEVAPQLEAASKDGELEEKLGKEDINKLASSVNKMIIGGAVIVGAVGAVSLFGGETVERMKDAVVLWMDNNPSLVVGVAAGAVATGAFLTLYEAIKEKGLKEGLKSLFPSTSA